MAVTPTQLPVADKADGAPGSAAPASAIQVAGSDGTSLRTLHTDSAGNLITEARVALTPSSPTTASVGVATGVAVAFNANRKGLVLTNTSSARISLAFGVAAVLNNGITLYPGGIFVMDAFVFTSNSVSAIASAAASNLAIQEFT